MAIGGYLITYQFKIIIGLFSGLKDIFIANFVDFRRRQNWCEHSKIFHDFYSFRVILLLLMSNDDENDELNY